jgi:hypothetical protein
MFWQIRPGLILPRGGVDGASTPVVSNPTTFDPGTADAGSGVTLSNGNRTATRTSTSTVGTQSIAYKTSGKHYWEATVTQSGGSTDFIGLMASGQGYFGMINGNAGSGPGVWRGNGSVVNNGGGAGSVGSGLVNGDVVCIAYDADNNLVWFRKNGGLWFNNGTADPATTTGGLTPTGTPGFAPVIAFSQYGSPVSGDNYAANFGQTTFAYTVPTGFAPGWAA